MYNGELKQLGKVEDLLSSQDKTQIVSSTLSEEALKEIEEVIVRHQGKVQDISHPTNSLEELFLQTVADSQARPGQRFVADEADKKEPSEPSKSA